MHGTKKWKNEELKTKRVSSEVSVNSRGNLWSQSWKFAKVKTSQDDTLHKPRKITHRTSYFLDQPADPDGSDKNRQLDKHNST